MASNSLETHIETIRRFSRVYTRTIGLLDEVYLESPYNLSAVRILYELAHAPQLTASSLASDLAMDPGYLSRILRQLERDRLIVRTPSPIDRRQTIMQLSEEGQNFVASLEQRSREELAQTIETLAHDERQRLSDALATAAEILSPEGGTPAPFIIRSHRPGDLGWIVARHGALYVEEFGWDATFEAEVARIAADFIGNFDAFCERCWIAVRGGENIGSIALVKHPDRPGVAKLRLLLVEPSARGLGLGKHLVDECLRFARQSGYHTVTLWTFSELSAASHIYQSVGFQLIREEPQHVFGRDMIEQTWELRL